MATTVLAIDDSVTMRKVLEMTFAGEDYRIVTAESADAALGKLRAERPSVVLCDLTLDGGGGYGLCAKIKAENPTIAVMILASKQQPYDGQQGQAARADDYIEKPFDTQQLIEKVKRLAARPITDAQPVQAAAPMRPAAAGATTQPGVPAVGPPLAARPSVTAPMGALAGTPPPPPVAARPPAPSPSGVNPRPPAPVMGAGAPSPQTPVGRGTLSYGGLPPSVPAPSQSAPAPARAPMQPAPAQAAPSAVAAPPAAAPVSPATPVGAVAAAASAANGQLAAKLGHMGLTDAQVSAVLALSREVVEKVVWEVVPVLAETMIREEIKRLTSE